MSRWTDFPEIDVPPLNVYRYELYANPITHVDAFEPTDKPALDRDREKPGPCAFGGSACDNGVKLLSYSQFKKKSSSGFADLPFHFVHGVFFFRAMFRQALKFIITIWQRTFSYRGLQQALCDKIGVPAIRGGGITSSQ